jgi:hypothetical protein
VDREVHIEVPQVEVQRIEVENTELIQQLKRLLELRDQELDRARGEVDRCREAQRRLEIQLQEALRVEVHQEVKSERLAETFVVPRVPLQVYSADPSDQIDVKLAEHLSNTMCWVPFRRKSPGQYEFGMLAVQMKLEHDKLMVKAASNPEFVSFQTFMQMCEASEFEKSRMDSAAQYPSSHTSSLNGNGTVMPMREPMRSKPGLMPMLGPTSSVTVQEHSTIQEYSRFQEFTVETRSEGRMEFQSQHASRISSSQHHPQSQSMPPQHGQNQGGLFGWVLGGEPARA